MDNQRSYLFFSGLISFSLFTFVLASFFYILFSPNNIKSYALKKDNYITVSLLIESLKSKNTTSINSPDITIPTQSKNVDIDNLFSKVWTKKIKEDKQDNKRIQELNKRIKTSELNEVESISEKINNINNMKKSDQNSPVSTASEVNEYLAKIQALVYKYFYPPANSEGYSVKAVIQLNSIGKVLDFRILTPSSNADLNKECSMIKDRLKSVVFPINPDNKSGNYIVILKSEE